MAPLLERLHTIVEFFVIGVIVSFRLWKRFWMVRNRMSSLFKHCTDIILWGIWLNLKWLREVGTRLGKHNTREEHSVSFRWTKWMVASSFQRKVELLFDSWCKWHAIWEKWRINLRYKLIPSRNIFNSMVEEGCGHCFNAWIGVGSHWYLSSQLGSRGKELSAGQNMTFFPYTTTFQHKIWWHIWRKFDMWAFIIQHQYLFYPLLGIFWLFNPLSNPINFSTSYHRLSCQVLHKSIGYMLKIRRHRCQRTNSSLFQPMPWGYRIYCICVRFHAHGVKIPTASRYFKKNTFAPKPP